MSTPPKKLSNIEELKRRIAAAKEANAGSPGAPNKNEIAGTPPMVNPPIGGADNSPQGAANAAGPQQGAGAGGSQGKDHGPDALAMTLPSEPGHGPSQPPSPVDKGAATAPLGPGGRRGHVPNGDGLVPIEPDSPEGIDLFGWRINELKRVISENKPAIQKEKPKLPELYVTLRLEKAKFTLLGIEPPELRLMLEQKLDSALETLEGDVRGENESRGLKCRFKYTLIWNTSVLEAPKPPSKPPESVSVELNEGMLGIEGKALVAEGRVPLFKELCNPYPLPGQNGYVFVVYSRSNGVPAKKYYEIRQEKEDDFEYHLGVYKVQDGKTAPVDERNPVIRVAKVGGDERYALMDEGLEINISAFKGGLRSIRLDPLRMPEPEPAPMKEGYDREIAAGIVGAGATLTLAFLPQLATLFHAGSVPASVAVGSLTLPVQQFFGIAASAIAALDAIYIMLGISEKTGGNGKR